MMTGKILVVEDDKFTGRMMELQFQKHGYDITVAPNGEEALKSLDSQSYDLVLSDVTMPGISGLELLRQIRTRHDRVQLPVILVTAMENSPKMSEALRLEVNDFFTKPKEFSLTLARVKLQVEWRQALLGNGSALPEGSGFRGLKEGLWSWSISKDSVQYSKEWKAILGYGTEELGSSISEWYDRIHPEDLKRVKDAIKAHITRQVSMFGEDFRMAAKDGAWIWVHAFGVALFDKSGVAARMVGSLCNIMDKKEALKEASNITKDLARTSEALSHFSQKASLTPDDRSQLNEMLETMNKIVARYNELT